MPEILSDTAHEQDMGHPIPQEMRHPELDRVRELEEANAALQARVTQLEQENAELKAGKPRELEQLGERLASDDPTEWKLKTE